MTGNIKCSAADVAARANADKLRSPERICGLKHTLRRASSELRDELRYPHVGLRGLAGGRLLYYTAAFICAAPPRLRRGQMGGADTELIDRRVARLSAAVTISCLTRERSLLISFLVAGWPLSGSRVIQDDITDLVLQTWIL